MIIRKSWATPDNNNNNRGDGKEGGEEGKGEREEGVEEILAHGQADAPI